MIHIVLYEPDIPWNTGNVGRSCVATGSRLHLVGKLGFSTDSKEIRRSGLDYWEKLNWVHHTDWESFLKSTPVDAAFFFFSKKAKVSFWEAKFKPESYLIFGCETKGLPENILAPRSAQTYRIPMIPDSVRSLNLSTSVGIVLYEALRQLAPHPAPSPSRGEGGDGGDFSL
jgi:tRNA (cytidine/uridine-2'-O-)-methyltransferase